MLLRWARTHEKKSPLDDLLEAEPSVKSIGNKILGKEMSTYRFNQKTVRGITYVCNEAIFDSRPFMYNKKKIFLKKIL